MPSAVPTPAPAAKHLAPYIGNGNTNGKVHTNGKAKSIANRPYVLPISARDENALKRYVAAFADLLDDHSLSLTDVCYSAGARKEQHLDRLVVSGPNRETLQQRLRDWLENPADAVGIVRGKESSQLTPLTFVFTGQGAQWWAMGRELLTREPLYRKTIEKIDALLQPLAGWSLLAEMQRPESESKINQTAFAQPAIFALQVGLSELWKSWGIIPEKVVGHSVGEVAAAYCAGIYSLEDAVKVIFHRSRLQDKTAGTGRMLAAGISAAEARNLIGDRIDQVQVGAINSSNLVTLAGDTQPLEAIATELEKTGTFMRWLRVNYAFHTHQMEPIKQELLEVLGDLQPCASQIPFVSTVTGGVLPGETLDAYYWWRNVRYPVLFSPAVQHLIESGSELFLEIGPHPALISSLNQCLADQGKKGAVFYSLRRDADDSTQLSTNLAGLHCHGVKIDWASVNQSSGHLVRLPRYPWSHERYWLSREEMTLQCLVPTAHPLLGRRMQAPKPTWEFDLDPTMFDYLEDHSFWDSIVFPGAGYGEIGIALARLLFPDEPYVVENVDIKGALFVLKERPPTVRVVFDETDKSYRVYSSTGTLEEWKLHAEGRLTQLTATEPTVVDLANLRQSLPTFVSGQQYYDEFSAAGYQFGPRFQHIHQVWRKQGEALAEVIVPEAIVETVQQYHFHPAVLDACFHIFKGVQNISLDAVPEDYFYLPEFIRRIRVYCDKPPTRFFVHGKLIADDGKSLFADIFVYDDEGNKIADILGFRADHVEQKKSADDIDNCYYQFAWEVAAVDAAESSAEPAANESGNVVLSNSNTSPATPKSLPDTSSLYLVFADQSGVGNSLCSNLAQQGYHAVCVRIGSEFAKLGPREFTVRGDSLDDLRRVVADHDLPIERLTGIVHCWSIDHPGAAELDSASLLDAQTTGSLYALRLVHLLGAREFAKAPRVQFITRGVQPVLPEDACDRLASSPLVGFVRVANNEHPAFRWTVVDLDRQASDREDLNLLQEVLCGDDELEIAYRHDVRYVNRLKRVQAEDLPKRKVNAVAASGKIPYRLQTEKPGILTNLELHETVRRAPQAGEIEVEVKAGGVNFRDVMKALGMYPGNPIDLLWFGDDFSGTVVRVGEGVTDLKVGDEVAGMAPYSFRAFTTIDRRMCIKKPAHLSYQEAATLPTVFLTSQYAISYLARMEPGESILIHAGTGGVGQAAIQIAQHLGLEVFATAGNNEKRQMLRDMGVKHVMNSRSLDFADEIMALTGGRGVDAVLNSLAGDFIPKSFSVLAPFGRFLEIGKVDVYGNTKIGLEPLRNNISYFVIDLAQHLEHRPQFIASLFKELSDRFEAGDYRPLSYKVFPITEVVSAFRYMAQGKHVGKNVLDFEVSDLPICPCTEDGHLFRADATYLIVGGASGFGLEHAKWMAQHGAKHLVLLSRSGPRDEAAVGDIQRLRDDGIEVIDARGDVSSLDDVRRIIRDIAKELPPLRGVIHGAMVLDDEFIAELNDQRFNKVLHPKMLGAWNLHVATLDAPLEHFVCFSSFSNVVGGAKQSNYNAGNNFLDALAHYRHALGLPALTYNWTALSGAGFVERNEKTAQYLDKIGMKAFTMDEAFRVYRRMLTRDPVQLGACRADWNALSRFSPMIANTRTFTDILSDQRDSGAGGLIGSRILSASPTDQLGLVENFIAEQVAGVFSIESARVDRDAPLTTLGLDSLMAIDLMNRIESELGVTLAMGSVLSGSSVKDFAKVVLRLVLESARSDTNGETGDTSEVVTEVPLEPLAYPEEAFPLTAVQKDLWLRYRTAPNNTTLHLATVAQLAGAVNVAALNLSLRNLCERHPMLKVQFCEIEGEPLQRYGTGPHEIGVHAATDSAEVLSLAKRLVSQSFDLSQGAPLRVELINPGSTEPMLVIAAHQLAVDKISLGLIVQELIGEYQASMQGSVFQPLLSKVSFQDFAVWQGNLRSADLTEKTVAYWNDLLKDAPLTCELPGTHVTTSGVADFRATSFALSVEASQEMVMLAAEQDVPLATVLMTAFQFLLHRVANQSDVLLESLIYGRPQSVLRRTIGPFAHTVPVRSRTGDDPTFLELLKRNQSQLQSAVNKLPVALSQVLPQVQSSSVSATPRLPVGFAMLQAPGLCDDCLTPLSLGAEDFTANVCGMSLRSLNMPLAQQGNALAIAFQEAGGIVYGAWQYDASQYSDTTLANLHVQLAQLFAEVAHNPETRLAQLKTIVASASDDVGRKTTKQGVIAAIERSRAGREAAEIDFAAEATLDPAIVPPAGAVACELPPRSILLTGGTGFVGAFLIQELLAHTDATLYCLVRAADSGRAMKRLRENLAKYDLSPPAFESRVIPVSGDFSKPLLGLSAEQFEKLAATVDAIYHNGADVNLGATYVQLKNTNVLGTQEVLRLAATKRLKPVHFVSTFTVLANDANRNSVVREQDDLPPPETLLHGYSQTKWVSERLIHAAQERGIPASIYRPGHVTGHSRTGASNTEDLLHTILLTCWRMGSAPLRSGEMDMTPVDYVAKAIVALSMRRENLGRTFHLTNPNPLDHRHLVHWMQRGSIGIRPVPYDQWRSELLALTARTPIEALQTLVQTMVPDAANYNGVAPPLHPKYDCRETLSALTDLDVRCAEVDDRLLGVYLEYFRRMGSFPETATPTPGPASLTQ